MTAHPVSISQSQRLLSERASAQERAVPLSQLDATTANFSLTTALWLFEAPSIADEKGVNLIAHLRESLRVTLNAYPQWCGFLKSVTTIDGTVAAEAKHFPSHTRRLGRLYVHYGTSLDPGAEFVTASSAATIDVLHPLTRPSEQPLWNQQETSLQGFIPPTAIANGLQPNVPDENGLYKPLLAAQVTSLACGGIALAAKLAHPLADISCLVHFMKDWACVSRSIINTTPLPTLKPLFDPGMLDALAAGDINAEKADTYLIRQAENLPLHRFDWWAPSTGCPFPVAVPEILRNETIEPAGKAMPWAEWDVTAPVSHYIIHLSRDQVDLLWKAASADQSSRISRHDAVLAHIWSCIMRSRNMDNDSGPVHCDLVLGLRSALELDGGLLGSPIIMINVNMLGKDVASTQISPETGENSVLNLIAQRIRDTISLAGQKENLAAYLHSAAYETTPQRIWQAFLGQRHILVTTWARAGLYEVDSGFGSRIRFADGVTPNMDGNILIKEAPSSGDEAGREESSKKTWTENGVDISVQIRSEDMERLLNDPLLLPKV